MLNNTFEDSKIAQNLPYGLLLMFRFIAPYAELIKSCINERKNKKKPTKIDIVDMEIVTHILSCARYPG